MNGLLEWVGIVLAGLLAENFVLVTCMGIGTRMRSFRDPIDAIRTGYSLTAVMVLGTLVLWIVYHFILVPLNVQFLQLFVFALVIPTLVYGLQLFLKFCIPELYQRIHGHLSDITTNCAALGCTWLCIQRNYSLFNSLSFALFGGIGVTVALASFAKLLSEVDLNCCPLCFRGIPMQLITAGLMALSLVGFYGFHIG